MKKVLVCGSRTWTNLEKIMDTLSSLKEEIGPYGIIHGGAQGADLLAHCAARRLDIPVIKTYPASTYGNPLIRNKVMVDTKPDLVIAFKRGDAHRSGTQATINYAESKSIPIRKVRW